MAKIGMVLCVHGEVTDPSVDIFDREKVFIDRVLEPLRRDIPNLRIVLEHVTTKEAVDYVMAGNWALAATITAHHLVINRNALFEGGLRPHMYCLPVAKRLEHQMALRKAATSGSDKFFLGTDSAPHAVSDKEKDCGCAGIFSAPTALEIYAHVFDEEGALGKLEAFASLNGPGFYSLPVNEEKITLERGHFGFPKEIIVSDGSKVIPFLAGKYLPWRVI
jgi:dihydroorotase